MKTIKRYGQKGGHASLRFLKITMFSNYSRKDENAYFISDIDERRKI